jgi:AraC family transcriptional activator FtrA
MACAAHLSTRSLTRRFAQATGTSPARWLLEQRIAASTELLERTDLAVEDVGALVGIPSPAAFRRHFARVKGVPPSAYRRAFTTASAA